MVGEQPCPVFLRSFAPAIHRFSCGRVSEKRIARWAPVVAGVRGNRASAIHPQRREKAGGASLGKPARDSPAAATRGARGSEGGSMPPDAPLACSHRGVRRGCAVLVAPRHQGGARLNLSRATAVMRTASFASLAAITAKRFSSMRRDRTRIKTLGDCGEWAVLPWPGSPQRSGAPNGGTRSGFRRGGIEISQRPMIVREVAGIERLNSRVVVAVEGRDGRRGTAPDGLSTGVPRNQM